MTKQYVLLNLQEICDLNNEGVITYHDYRYVKLEDEESIEVIDKISRKRYSIRAIGITKNLMNVIINEIEYKIKSIAYLAVITPK